MINISSMRDQSLQTWNNDICPWSNDAIAQQVNDKGEGLLKGFLVIKKLLL